jgi:hypothetical protein
MSSFGYNARAELFLSKRTKSSLRGLLAPPKLVSVPEHEATMGSCIT